MANQTLQKDKKNEGKQQVQTNHTIAGFGTPYTSQGDAMEFAKNIASCNSKVVFHVTVDDKHAKRFKNKPTGFTEKINPFADKPFVRPKVVQQKIDAMKRLLKASPIPKEFLKS